jgi:hypothetical protein
MHQVNPSLLAAIGCLSLILLPACSSTAAKSESMTDTQACEQIQSLISAHANQFNEYKKTLSPQRRGNIWTAKEVFPDAHNCQVWEWSAGLNNYVCQWKSKEGESQAKADYQAGVTILKNCLGSEWSEKTSKTQSGGESALFSKEDGTTVVSVRYFKENRSLFDSWNNTVLVGDRSNIKQGVQ